MTPQEQPDSQATTWQDVAEYFLGDYAREHTPDECRKEAYRRNVRSDSQAGDELELVVEKVLAGHYIKYCDYSEEKAVIADYAERLATERAIAELKALRDHLIGDIYDDTDKSSETNAGIIDLLSKRIAALSAKLTKEAKQ